MRLLLVSHAQTEWTDQGIFQGHTDIPLNERGRRQAHILQNHLAQEEFQAIVASDLRRATETAAILALPHGMSVATDPRLREMHFGEWEGLTYADIQQRFPTALAAWRESPLQMGPPQGEQLGDVERRLQGFVRDLGCRSQESTILLVAHRGSLRTLLCILLGLPVERHWEFRLEVASLSEVRIVAGKATLMRINEMVEA
ncbi:MAG TPA: alpha-ribazole phosphatase [Gemmataceae bacterium]|jgi:alpha-ribazole phosphatase|nr:alpha-ribazole phosphatase [Gemmataceae bacterium]